MNWLISDSLTHWKDIGRLLLREDVPERPYAFSDDKLRMVEANGKSVPELCLREVLETWIEMSDRHTIGPLFGALSKIGIGDCSWPIHLTGRYFFLFEALHFNFWS